MAKALVALVLCALVVASVASQSATRSLQQDIQMNCDAAKRISSVSNACNLLCSCASALQKNKEGKANDADVKRCNDLCPKCSDAGKTCKPGSDLPGPCKEGTTNTYVQQCINTYLKSQRN
jgi:hypothetical protein